MPIRTRLILLFTMQVVIIVLFAGGYLNWRLRETIERELADKLKTHASIAALQFDHELVTALAPGDESTRTYNNLRTQLLSLQEAGNTRRIFIISPNRTSLLDTKDEVNIGDEYPFLGITDEELKRVFNGELISSTLFTGSDGRLYKTAFAPISSETSVVAVLALEGSAQTLEAIADVRHVLLVIAVIVLVGSAVLGLLFSRRLTTPLERLKAAAGRIAKGDYDTPVQDFRKDEIGFLANTMEEMRRAIVQRDTRQKTMLAGVAHEIRNPLGGIELFAGLLASELEEPGAKAEAEKIKKEVQNLKKIVGDFLDYARPRKAQRKQCNVGEIFEEAKTLLAGEIGTKEIKFTANCLQETAWVDPQHLRQIFLNLIQNSIRAIAERGEITLAVTRDGAKARVLLTDDGPGIPEKIRADIFNPFVSGSREGTGLGLAIVRTLVEENGGEIDLHPGPGAVFEITLPA